MCLELILMKKLFNSIAKIRNVILLFVSVVVFSSPCHATNGSIFSPEFSAFEPIDATDMVNLVSGDFSYVIPMLTVPSPEGGYPIALSYHGGISLDQQASWTGLGWSLNAGAISRNVSGVPDDIKRGSYTEILYDQGGVFTSWSGSVGLSFANGSAGLYFSHTSHKAFGGKTTYNSGFGIQASFKNIGASIGTNGVGLSYDVKGAAILNEAGQEIGRKLSPVSFGLNYDWNQGEFSASVSTVGSVGLTLSSGGSAYFSAGTVSRSLFGDNISVSPKINADNSNFQIYIPLGFLKLSFGRQRTKYWIFDKSSVNHNGVLYAGDVVDFYNEAVFPYKISFDSYEVLYKEDKNQERKGNNMSYVSYDNYSVASQGISGSIKPALYEHGSLLNKFSRLDGTESSNSVSIGTTARYLIDNDIFTKNIDDPSNDIHFYFDNVYASYLRVISDDWDVNNTTYGLATDLSAPNQRLESTLNSAGGSYNNYNSITKRKTQGPYIEVYTNQEIVDGAAIIEAKGFSRDLAEIPASGIGAYTITTIDGKTYHYSLPVYQKEKFSRSSKIDADIDSKYYEMQSLDSYATHWLLTAITGADYIDVNGNGEVDENDYGYWVEFDYGKWSDGYVWRTPTEGFIYSYDNYQDGQGPGDSKFYEWGIKEVYYLDKIKTRTHTAFFIKSEREDDVSSTFLIGQSRANPVVIPSDHINDFREGNDGNIYLSGLYKNYPFSSVNALAHYASGEHSYFMGSSTPHKTLKLEQIILLRNEDVPSTFLKSNTNAPTSNYAADVYIHEHYTIRKTGTGQIIKTVNNELHNEHYEGEFYNNLYDVQDIQTLAPNIEDVAKQVVVYEYDPTYPLGTNSPNSQASSKGRLTLSSINIKGEKGTQLMPPYNFTYYHPNISFAKEDQDDWGYHKSSPEAWSLKEIETPIGAVIKVNYEADNYYTEAVSSQLNEPFKHTVCGAIKTGDELKLYIREPMSIVQGINVNLEFKKYTLSQPNGCVPFCNGYNATLVNEYQTEYSVIDVNLDEGWVRLESTPQTSNHSLFPSSIDCGNSLVSLKSCSENYYDIIPGYDGQLFLMGPPYGAANICPYVVKLESNTNYTPGKGGGLRVTSIETTNGIDTYETKYEYTQPVTGISSGVTSYSPSKYFKEIKYVSELPPPSVMYEYVTVKEFGKNGSSLGSIRYQFETLKPLYESPNNNIQLGKALSIEKLQDAEHSIVQFTNESDDDDYVGLYLSKYEIKDNIASLGRMLKMESFDEDGELLSWTQNHFKPIDEISQGVSQETFSTYKFVKRNDATDYYQLSTTSKVQYPSVLEKSEVYDKRLKIRTTTYSEKFDFNTGNLIESRSKTSDGYNYLTKEVPAYTIYPDMGSKVVNENNTNMLAAKYAKLTYKVEDNDNDGIFEDIGLPVSASVQTWDNEWEYVDDITQLRTGVIESTDKVWRKHSNYYWSGSIDDKGRFKHFIPFYNWQNNPNIFVGYDQENYWKKVGETTLYNRNSYPLESWIGNDQYQTSRMDVHNELVVSTTAGASYEEAVYTGLERIPNSNLIQDVLESGIVKGNISTLTSNSSDVRTGLHSLQIPGSSLGLSYNLPLTHVKGEKRGKTYRTSVWVKGTNSDVVVKLMLKRNNVIYNEVTVSTANSDNVALDIDDWKLVNLDYTIDENMSDLHQYNIVVEIFNNGVNEAFIDDFRFYPLSASMISYVYDDFRVSYNGLKTNNVSYIINDDNLYTRYEYDELGRLIATYIQTEGGEKKVSEFKMNYKNN